MDTLRDHMKLQPCLFMNVTIVHDIA